MGIAPKELVAAIPASCSQVVDLVVTFLFLLPEGEVLLEELNDALGIAEVILLQLIDLVEGGLESSVGELAGLRVVLKHLVVEDAEVEGEAELDGVACGKIDAVGLLVGGLGLGLDRLELVVFGVLGDVAVVVTDHLHKEGLGLVRASLSEHFRVDHVNDFLAVSGELALNAALVLQKCAIELGVFRVSLDSRDGAAGSSLGGDKVLESDGKEVTLVGVDFASLLDEDSLKEIDHVVKALGLLSDTGEENLLFNLGHLLCFAGSKTLVFKFTNLSHLTPTLSI